MKTKNIILLLLLSVFTISLSAQQGRGARQQRGHHHQFDVEKHHHDRAEFISEELKLTEAEKKVFIPLMEEYIHARYALNRELRTAMRELMSKKNRTEADYQKVIDMEIEMNAKEVELQKKYYKKFSEILSSEKIFRYGFAEKKFTKRAVKCYHRDQKEETE